MPGAIRPGADLTPSCAEEIELIATIEQERNRAPVFL
jgi:hypothetical protein